jgi:hypothetical protein
MIRTMSNNKVITIAEDFSRFPGGRFKTDGPFSGEAFRDKILVPAIQESDQVEVNLSGTLGYGSSFLEEAFGGLIREHSLSLEVIQKKLVIKSDKVSEIKTVWQYIKDADKNREK